MNIFKSFKNRFYSNHSTGPQGGSGIGWLGYALSGALLAVLLVIRVIDPGMVQGARLQIFDLYQQLQPRPSASQYVVTVDIDEKSLSEIGQWPWPRNVLADLTNRLTAMGAVVIAFDAMFPERDRMSPPQLAHTIPGLDEKARKALGQQPSNDSLFAQAMKKSRVVLATAAVTQPVPAPAEKVRAKLAIASIGGDPRRFLLKYAGIVHSLPELESAARGLGHVTFGPEPDGVVRRIPLVVNIDGKIIPTLVLEILRVATGRSAITIKSDDAGVSSIIVGKVSIPTSRDGRKWVYFSRPGMQIYVSASDILKRRVSADTVKGKLVLIGTSAAGLKDVRPTPVSTAMPGVEVHAQLLEAILSGANLSRPNYALGAELVILLMTGLLVIVLIPRIGALTTLASFIAVTAALAGGSWYLFETEDALIDVSYSIAGAFSVYTVVTFDKYMREETGRKVIRSAFDHYLSPEMVARLAEDPKQLTLGGEAREMTIMFSDVRGFTAISERTSAEDLTRLVNMIMTRLTDVVLEHNGTIDKYIGDCLMAFWNAPLHDPTHARNASMAALGMMEGMKSLNEELKREVAQGDSGLPENIAVGIGLNTGECLVGNMGSTHRFNYSVLGDTVNLTARLEGQTAYYGCPIILGEETAQQAADLALLEIDLILVKGKAHPSRIFALLGDAVLGKDKTFTDLIEPHNEMLVAYRARDWRSASERLVRCRALSGQFQLEQLYALYAERIRRFIHEDPGADWDGVFVAEKK